VLRAGLRYQGVGVHAGAHADRTSRSSIH